MFIYLIASKYIKQMLRDQKEELKKIQNLLVVVTLLSATNRTIRQPPQKVKKNKGNKRFKVT